MAVSRVRAFVRTSLLGGLVVLLPVGVLLIVFNWLYDAIRDLLAPLTRDYIDWLVGKDWPVLSAGFVAEFLAVLVVTCVLVAICFLTGVLLKTAVGKWFHSRIEENLLKLAPGYNLVKETVAQFFGDKPSPFRSTAFVRIYGGESPTMVTAFITDRHPERLVHRLRPDRPEPDQRADLPRPGRLRRRAAPAGRGRDALRDLLRRGDRQADADLRPAHGRDGRDQRRRLNA